MSGLLKTNEHNAERIVRIILGVGLIAAGVSGALGAWAYIGVVPLLTGVVGSCPIYTVLGISTCPMKTPQN